MPWSLLSLPLWVRGFKEPPAEHQPPCGLTQVLPRGTATRGHSCLRKSHRPRETQNLDRLKAVRQVTLSPLSSAAFYPGRRLRGSVPGHAAEPALSSGPASAALSGAEGDGGPGAWVAGPRGGRVPVAARRLGAVRFSRVPARVHPLAPPRRARGGCGGCGGCAAAPAGAGPRTGRGRGFGGHNGAGDTRESVVPSERGGVAQGRREARAARTFPSRAQARGRGARASPKWGGGGPRPALRRAGRPWARALYPPSGTRFRSRRRISVASSVPDTPTT